MPRYSQKSRAPPAHTSNIQFESGVSGKKPTAAKSAGTLGKWGVTSFTSIRSSIVNGSAHDGSADGRVASPVPPAPPADPFSFESTTPGAAPVRKVKKFFKSRNAPAVAGAGAPQDARRQLPMSRAPPPAPPPVHIPAAHSPADEKEEPECKRFFSSPAAPLPLRDTTGNRANSRSPCHTPAVTQPPRMPPLKLRISRDKDTGDLTAVSGPPADGGGATRRRRAPAAPPTQHAKTARYKSPPPPPRAPSSDRESPPPPPLPPADEDDAGGESDRPVRRTRRAAAVEARQRVAKTVRYGEDDEDEEMLVAAVVASSRTRRAPRRRPSVGDTAAVEAPVAAEVPAPVQQMEASPAAAGASPPPPASPPPADEPMADSPPPPPSPPTPTPPPPQTPPPPAQAAAPAVTAARMPVLTAAPTLLESAPPSVATATAAVGKVASTAEVTEAPTAAQHETSPAPAPAPAPAPETSVIQRPPVTTQETAQTTARSHTTQSALAAASQVPAPAPAQAQPAPAQAQAVPAGEPGSEPVNLSTRQPAADLERELSALFGEPLPPAPAPAPAPAAAPAPAPAPAEAEPTSRVYRKGIKDLGRYQRTQETRGSAAAKAAADAASSTAAATAAAAAAAARAESVRAESLRAESGSPQPGRELERQLELLESGRAPSAAAAAAAAVGAGGSDSGLGASQDSDVTPALARANTEPVMTSASATVPASSSSSSTGAGSGAGAGAGAGAKPVPAEPKKGSIFKTRSGQSRAARARYNHRWTDDKEDAGHTAGAAASAPAAGAAAKNDAASAGLSAMDFTDDPPPSAVGGGGAAGALSGRLTRVSTWHGGAGADPNGSQQPVTSVRVDRRAKEYYTVIQNVKKAYQIQEFGEFQEYNDDIDYIMDALQPTNSLSTRCLAATRLAGKCTVAAFRMHLRAHGTVTRFFAALADAPSDPCLSLCTSAVMFILSEDQLNMDLDKSSLELMLSLLDSDSAAESDESNAELRKNRAKVRELCAELQRRGQAKQLRLDSISAGHLSMETLLSLTSQRAGAWFKEELRELGGLDRLLGTVSESLRALRLPQKLRHQRDSIARISRCLRVVENVTSRNEENQQYLLRAGGGEAVQTLSRLFQLAETELSDCSPAEFQPADGAARVLLEMTDTLMKVLVNLSSVPAPRSARAGSALPAGGGAVLGAQAGLLPALLHAVLRLPERLPEQRQFDVLLLAMYLLMNLAEGDAENRSRVAAAPAPPRHGQLTLGAPAGSALSELAQMFYRLVRLACEVESHTDRILDGTVPAAPPPGAGGAGTGAAAVHQDAGEVTATALIQKAGHHMEKTVIAAYIGVLLGHLAMDNAEQEAAVRAQLTGGRFADVVDVLRKLLSFMDLTNTGRPETLHEMKTMQRIIDFMTRADRAPGDGSGASSFSAAAGGSGGMGAGAFSCEDLGVLDMSL